MCTLFSMYVRLSDRLAQNSIIHKLRVLGFVFTGEMDSDKT